MKRFAVVIVLLLEIALVGCGSNKNSGNINGTWNATLLGSNANTVFTFGTSLTTNGDGSLTVTNFNFTSNSPCFVSGETESGSFSLSGDFNGNVSGGFGLNVASGNPSGNTLSLTGTVAGNTIAGKWTLTGGNPSGCTGSGTFTMTKV